MRPAFFGLLTLVSTMTGAPKVVAISLREHNISDRASRGESSLPSGIIVWRLSMNTALTRLRFTSCRTRSLISDGDSPGVSSRKSCAPASFLSDASACIQSSFSIRSNPSSFSIGMPVSAEMRRFDASTEDSCMEKTAVGSPNCTALFRAIRRRSVDFPTHGRPPITISSPRFHPRVILSMDG